MPQKNTTVGLFVLLAALWWASGLDIAHAKRSEPFRPPAKQTLEIRGFSKNGKEVALFVKDANRGAMFQVRKVNKNKLVKTY